MSKISVNVDKIIQKAERTVASHRIGKGDYARYLWQNAKCDREMGSNPYGCADAANILYTIGKFPHNNDEREGFVRTLRAFQDPDTGLFYEHTHHPYHTTAHCIAALELFDKLPSYPLSELKRYDDIPTLCEFLDSLDWVNDPWRISHNGAGVFAAKIIAEDPSLKWQDAYFDFVTSHCDKKYGMGYEGAIDAGSKPISHHLNGWFHYMFNFNHCHRQFPLTEKLIDTLIDMYKNNMLDSNRFGVSMGFREIDWVFPLNRATQQIGYRREEAKELMRDFAVGYLAYLESLDETTNDSFNDLHMLFGSMCCVSELQLALVGEIFSEKPLKNVLDRRPFI